MIYHKSTIVYTFRYDMISIQIKTNLFILYRDGTLWFLTHQHEASESSEVH